MNKGKMETPSKSRKHINQNLPPSHPDFDRSLLSQDEFIEQLLYENRELQAVIDDQTKLIERLQEQRKESGLPIVISPTKTFISDIAKPTNIPENNGPIDANNDNVPQRSARRRENGISQEANQGKSVEKKESLSSLSSFTSRPRNTTLISSTSSEFNDRNEKAVDPSNRSSMYSDEYQNDITKSSNGELSKVNTADSTINTLNSANTTKSLKSSDSKVQVIESKTPNSGGYHNYKSRLKLPLTLQQQQQSHNKESASKDTLLDNRSPNTDERSLHSSEVDYSNPFNDSRITTPQSRNLATFDDYSNISLSNLVRTPMTPETIYSGKFSSQATDYISTNSAIRKEFQARDTNRIDEPLKTPLIDEYNKESGTFSRPHFSQSPSFQVVQGSKEEEYESSLFIKPEDFQTIRISVVSTINVKSSTTSSKSDDPYCTISINDKETSKEMWRIKKSYSQLIAFDNEIRPLVEYFGLPQIPDKSLFLSSTPNKVDSRRVILQNYFNTLFLMPHIPRITLFRICRYLSLDFVNPLDDYRSGARKEGFLIRRYKGLGNSWKIRWCQVDGPYLEIYDIPGGPILEQIKLKGSQIGKQSNDSVAEEKGFRHAFLIMESQKTSKLSSSYPKHFFCAESDDERDSWIEALFEFNDAYSMSTPDDVSTIVDNTPKRYDAIDENEGNKAYDSAYSHEDISGDIKDSKEIKRLKKRSIFPFRNKYVNQIDSGSSEDVSSSQIPENQSQTVQSYLEQLNLDEDLTKAIFGRELTEAITLSSHIFMGKEIPSICFRCLDYLTKTGACYEEGIFRLSGSASTIRLLKDQFNSHFDIDLFVSDLKPDIHTVAGLLKNYLRELPSPILGTSTISALDSIVAKNKTKDASQLALDIKNYINTSNAMHQVNYDTSYVIFNFLREIIANNQMNRMNLRNVCIVFVPTLNISLEILSSFLVDFECIYGNADPIPNDRREVLALHIPNF